MLYQFSRHFFAILIIPVCLILVSAVTACSATPTSTLSEGTPGDHTPSTATPSPSGAAPSEQPTTETPAAPPEPSPTPQPPTAVLFLIDESGGVSGRGRDCPQDPITDKDGLRYDLVRFYLSLWEAYYSDRWALSSDDKKLDNSPHLDVGVAQFARTQHWQTFPFTPASELFGSEEWKSFRQKLLSSEEMLRGFADDWFCATAYTDTLTAVVNQFPDDASQRILVLLTDGSFQGAIPSEPRDTARTNTQQVLRRLSDQGIKVHVVLLGEHICPGSDCPLGTLGTNDAAERNIDLDTWEDWSVSARAVEEETAFEMLGRVLGNLGLLPGAHYHSGWLSGSGEQTLPFFGGRTERVRVGIVTSRQPSDGSLHLLDEEGMEVDIYPQGPQFQWFNGEARVSSSPSECPFHTWTLDVREDLTAYYWLVTEEREVDVATPLTHLPEPVILNKGQVVTVTIRLTAQPLPYQCYSLIVRVDNQEQQPSLDESPTSLSVPFTLPMTLRWGSTLPIMAQVVYRDEPEKSPDPEEDELTVEFRPDIGPVIVDPDPVTYEGGYDISMTVPISWAGRIPDFKAHFAFFPKQFEELKEGEPPPFRGGCVIYADVAGAEAAAASWVRPVREAAAASWVKPVRKEEDIWYYQFAVPYEGVLEESCDYRYLRLRWTGGGKEDILLPWPEISRNSLSLIPTPIPPP